MFTYTDGGTSAGRSGADCRLNLTIVRPNLLSMPETLGYLLKKFAQL